MSEPENTTLGQDLRFGSWGKGAVSAIVSLISIVVLPLLILYFLETFTAGSGLDEELVGMIETMEGMIYRFAIYGSPMILLTFFNASYRKGSKAKLMLVLMSLGYSILWIFLILEGGAIAITIDFSTISDDMPIKGIDILLSIGGLIVIMVIFIMLKMILAFTKYGANRDEYLETYNDRHADQKYVPSIKTTFGQDLENGSFGKGMGNTFLRLFLIVLIPFAIMNYPEYITDAVNIDIEPEIFNFIMDFLYRFSLYGIPLVLLGFFTKSYKEGNKAWLVFRMLSLAYILFWVLMIFDKGEIIVPEAFEFSFEVQEYLVGTYEIICGVIIILLLIILLKMVATAASYGRKRKNYLRKIEESTDGYQHSN